jgi:hypothetical protein
MKSCIIGATGIGSDPRLSERARLCEAGDRLGRHAKGLRKDLIPVRACTGYFAFHGNMCA